MKFRGTYVALACAALFVPGGALAHTVTLTETGTLTSQTVPFTNIAVNVEAFNTALGTLTAVKVTFNATAVATVTATNTKVASKTLNSLFGQDTITISGPNTLSVPVVVKATATYSPAITLIQNASKQAAGTPGSNSGSTNPTDLADYESASPTPVYVHFSATAGLATAGGTGSTGLSYSLDQETAGGQVVVQYSYTPVDPPAAPEPSTWAMMALGFAGLGFAGYRARRTARAIV